MIRVDRLRQLMMTQRITQKALAEELDIPTSAAAKIVNEGRVDHRKLPRIARMLFVSQEYLLGQSDTPDISASDLAISLEQRMILELYSELEHTGRIAVVEIMRTMARAGKGSGSRLQERRARQYTASGVVAGF